MPTYKTGDIFETWDILVFSAGGTLNRNNELIDIEDEFIFPDILKLAGEKILQNGIRLEKQVFQYGLLQLTNNIYILQVGYNNDSNLGLIEYGVGQLIRMANEYPEKRIVMNYPGIGGLCITELMPIIRRLPKNVYVYTKRR